MGEKIFSQLESLARFFQLKYMAKRRTTEVVEPGRIRFHPNDVSQKILLKYSRRLKKLELK